MKNTFCTNCFKSLGVPSRMEIYRYLSEHNKATVSEIVDFVGLTQPTISYHLSEMKKNGILKSTKKGKRVFYTLRTDCPYFEANCVLNNLEFPEQSYA